MGRNYLAWLALAALGAGACAEASSSADAGGGTTADARATPPADAAGAPADARQLDSPDAAPGTPDAAPGIPDATPLPPDAAAPVVVTLTQSLSNTIVAENSVSCNGGTPDFFHSDNSYYRVFDLAALGVTGPFTPTNVAVGIEDATAGTGGSQPATLRFHTLSGAFTLANLTTVSTIPVTVADQLGTVLNVPITGVTIPAGSMLVVEVFTPDGAPASNRFFIGSNNLGETGPTYIRATDCAVTEPTTVSSLGFPEMAIVLNVTGSYQP